jgi:branched-chain amino acid transport system ATP-binding protein
MLLDVDGLEVRYGNVAALRGVGLSVGRAETVAVVGPNGAGKTTLLRAISGLVRASAGAITLDGRPIRRMSPHRIARAGFVHVPEGRGIVAPLTVQENLALGAQGLRGPAVREAEARMIDLFPVLGDRLHTAAGLLSGGEQQMLAIARALMIKPLVLAMDEPSMGLAPVIVDVLFEAFQKVASDGTALLIVEQNANLALDISDRAYVLVQGEVVTAGASDSIGERILENYLH